jgi:16S rRNA (uracil1498-N3)-methyltransferase
LRKFFVNSDQILENEIEIVGEDVNHIKNVLRLEKNEKIKIGNKVSGENYICEISNISRESIQCRIIEKIGLEVEGNVSITVFQGLPKADKMELIIQKGTELGVNNFVPVEFKRSIVKLSRKRRIKED